MLFAPEVAGDERGHIAPPGWLAEIWEAASPGGALAGTDGRGYEVVPG